jgi:hypothetical protein
MRGRRMPDNGSRRMRRRYEYRTTVAGECVEDDCRTTVVDACVEDECRTTPVDAGVEDECRTNRNIRRRFRVLEMGDAWGQLCGPNWGRSRRRTTGRGFTVPILSGGRIVRMHEQDIGR